jgi:hypothetical protein
MRNTIIILLTLLFVSCSNQEKRMVTMTEDMVKKELLDPNSYDRISYKMDTIRKSDYLKWDIVLDSMKRDFYQKLLNDKIRSQNIWDDDFTSKYVQEIINENSIEIKKYKDSVLLYSNRVTVKEKERKSIINTTKDNIIQYVVVLRYYAMSKGGLKVISEKHYPFDLNGVPIKRI